MCGVNVIDKIFQYDSKWSSDRTYQKSLIQPLKVEVSGTNTPPTSNSIHLRFTIVDVSAVKFSY